MALMATDSTREDLPRISVDSVKDWKRVKSNYESAALSRIDALLETGGLTNEKDLLRLHMEKFIEDVFAIARPNLRVNGRHFEDFNEHEQEVNAFDEALDRHIWSLSDSRLKWDNVIAVKRRTRPQEVESLLQDLFEQQQASELNQVSQDDEIFRDDSAGNINAETKDGFFEASALSKELNQVIPVQYGRSERVKSIANEVKALKP